MNKQNVLKTTGIVAGAVVAAGAKAAMTYGITKLLESGKAVTFKHNGKVYYAEAFEKEATEIKVSRKVRKTIPEAANLEAARLGATDIHERIANVTCAVSVSDLTVRGAIYGTAKAVTAVKAKLNEKKAEQKAEDPEQQEEIGEEKIDEKKDTKKAKAEEKKEEAKKPTFDDKNTEDQ